MAAKARVPFNLCALTNHDAFVFFDNASSDKADRLSILITIRQLQGKELEDTKKAIIAIHGEGAVHRRMEAGSTVESAGLEYMKYCIITHGKKTRIFDLDTRCEVENDVSQKKLEKSKAKSIEKKEEREEEDGQVGGGALQLGFEPHIGTSSNASRTVSINTEKHGVVQLRFQTFDDPDVRNAINISVERNLAIDSCWGAAVKAVAPKILRQRRWLKLPVLLFPNQIRKMHTSDTYWMTVEGMTEREGEMVQTSMTIPRRSRNKYRHYLQDDVFKSN